ncbi:MAG: glycosyltransferase, partial [Acetatifactor sp.]
MRIAMMTNNYRPFMGGVPVSIERLAGGLEELGHQVRVFAPTYKEQEEEDRVFRYSNLLNHLTGGIVLPNPFDFKIEREFQKNSYDILHVH